VHYFSSYVFSACLDSWKVLSSAYNLLHWLADHSGRVVEGMNRLLLLEHWDRGFQSHTRHGGLCAFILCVGSGLATG
jgi:hypothetical protein